MGWDCVTHSDLSWSETTTYACRCGAMFPTTVWRWIDADAHPDLHDAARDRGPLTGECPRCGEEPTAQCTWLSIRPSKAEAVLMVSGDRRADFVEELRAHLARVQERATHVETWLLSPRLQFQDVREETTARRKMPRRSAAPHPIAREEAGTPVPVAARASPRPVAVAGETQRVDSGNAMAGAGIPQPIGATTAAPASVMAPRGTLGALMGTLELSSGRARIRVEVPVGTVDKWREAKLGIVPVHLRGRGYPLLGVRLTAMYLGEKGVVDAIIDAGEPRSSDLFRVLAERFAIEARIEHDGERVTRSVEGQGLEPNAALCLESARGLMARGEYPPADFAKARAALGAESVQDRLEKGPYAISPGSYRHIIGAREAVTALKHLDRISKKDTLARLLEVDGLPMQEYDAIRRRVLEGSLQHGLCAPRRFWRRVVASGLAESLEDYAKELAGNRAAHEGEEGDLEAEDARAAWEAIAQLCRLKNIMMPSPVRTALGLSEPSGPPQSEGGPLSRASGEIIADVPARGPGGDGPLLLAPPRGRSPELDAALGDPGRRLKAAIDVLQGHDQSGDVDAVLDALEDFETDELLAILPDLSDLGPRVVPGLVAKLRSERREVRQAVVILLGMAVDPQTLEALSEHLVWEPTTVWVDVARALGAFGPSAIRVLCQVMARQSTSTAQSRAIDRVARAFAEVALSDGAGAGGQGPGHTAVGALADASDARVSSAARRALASLHDVHDHGAQIRGEIPLAEVTEIRGFSRRAYEAIMVPELEVEAEA